MSDEQTRIVYEFDPNDSISGIVERLLDPEQEQIVVRRVEHAVPWCETHDAKYLHSDDGCNMWMYQQDCRLQDPPKVWREPDE